MGSCLTLHPFSNLSHGGWSSGWFSQNPCIVNPTEPSSWKPKLFPYRNGHLRRIKCDHISTSEQPVTMTGSTDGIYLVVQVLWDPNWSLLLLLEPKKTSGWGFLNHLKKRVLKADPSSFNSIPICLQKRKHAQFWTVQINRHNGHHQEVGAHCLVFKPSYSWIANWCEDIAAWAEHCSMSWTLHGPFEFLSCGRLKGYSLFLFSGMAESENWLCPPPVRPQLRLQWHQLPQTKVAITKTRTAFNFRGILWWVTLEVILSWTKHKPINALFQKKNCEMVFAPNVRLGKPLGPLFLCSAEFSEKGDLVNLRSKLQASSICLDCLTEICTQHFIEFKFLTKR